jgi:2'-5' RNA ligase
MGETFHRRGHHVQKAHGRRAALAAQDDHLQGGMIALMPTAEDARRLALPGGESAAELHCTLYFLGDDVSGWTEEQRNELESTVRALVPLYELGPVQSKIFGVAHWNGGSEKPSWVWSVGDADPDNPPGLSRVRAAVTEALESTHERPDIPPQHQPWVAHICAAYTDDLTLVRRLEKGLGPVTFDRIRLSFGDDDRDIPLTGALTASALRRDALPHEEFTDFAEHNRQWENAVASANGRMQTVLSDWRAQLKNQIASLADEPQDLTALTVNPGDATEILSEAMLDLARRAGQSLAREAEKQGVAVPDWSLPDDVVTAAVGGRKLLSSVAKMTADLLATSVVQSAKRTVTGLFARDATPDAIATEVDRTLADAQDGLLKGPVGTAMTTAQTAGRQAVLQAAPPGEYYASEILDRNTCAPCRAVDGEQFGSLEIAIKAYPVMGYKDCVGPKYGHSCRGLIVARWTPEETVTAAADAVPFHGTLGDPGYHLLHPGNRGKGLRKLDEPRGGMIGSPDFTEEEHTTALSSYVLDPRPFNVPLRSGEGGGEKEEETRALNDFIDIQEPLAEPVTVLRGAFKLPEMKEGDEFSDRGFTSATEDEAVASLFAMAPLMQGKERGDTLHITIPKGTRVLEVYKVYPHGAESEFILPPGTTFRVTGVNDNGYDLEVVPHGG